MLILFQEASIKLIKNYIGHLGEAGASTYNGFCQHNMCIVLLRLGPFFITDPKYFSVTTSYGSIHRYPHYHFGFVRNAFVWHKGASV